MDTNVLMSRLMRVLRFDASVYREIAADEGAMAQAAVVVIVATILAALGQVGVGFVIVIASLVINIIGFAIYTALATLIAKMLQGKTGFNEMGRTLGYTYIWYGLGILAIIPGIGGFMAWVGQIVAGIAGIIALRESSEFETWKAVVTVIVASIIVGFITATVIGSLIVMLGLAAAAATPPQ